MVALAERFWYPCLSNFCCQGPDPCPEAKFEGDGITCGTFRICCGWALEWSKTCDCTCHICFDRQCGCPGHQEPQMLSAIHLAELQHNGESHA